MQRSLSALTHLFFGAFLVLTLSTPSLWLRASPFLERAPLRGLAELTGSFGLPVLASTLVCVGWLAARLLERPLRPWRWGDRAVTLPLLGLTLLALNGLDPSLARPAAVQVVKLLAFTWLVYLFVLNENPRLLLPLSLVVLIQGTVALGQFLSQGNLGLAALGELTLNTDVGGISILWVGDRAWIRGYGLTDHPNLLGTILAVCLLLLLPGAGAHVARAATGTAMKERRSAAAGSGPRVMVAEAVGLLGLLATFSRAALLGFAAGLAMWGVLERAKPGKGRRPSLVFTGVPRLMLIPLFLTSALFLFTYRDLVASRLLIRDNPVEARSVGERLRDGSTALGLIAAHPFRGVGAGNYFDSARALDPAALTVHNITLLVAAELGLPGAALWLWLALYPLVRARGAHGPSPPGHQDTKGRRASSEKQDARVSAVQVAPWVAWLVNGLFDPNPWPWMWLSSAVLFGLLAAQLANFGTASAVKPLSQSE